jgi:hypothetical protein
MLVARNLSIGSVTGEAELFRRSHEHPTIHGRVRIVTVHALAVHKGLVLDLESARGLILVAGQAK